MVNWESSRFSSDMSRSINSRKNRIGWKRISDRRSSSLAYVGNSLASGILSALSSRVRSHCSTKAFGETERPVIAEHARDHLLQYFGILKLA